MAERYSRFIKEEFDAAGRLIDYHYDLPENFNYGYDVLDALAEEFPDRLAMLWRNDKGAEVRLTFADFRRHSNQIANLLTEKGLKRGDVLLAALRMHWQYWAVALACHKLGVILAPVYHRLSTEDFRYRMEMAQIKAVVCCQEGETPERIREAAEKAGVPLRLTIDGAHPGFLDLEELAEKQPDTMERVETRGLDPMLLYFTSGTTGKPKGVLHDFFYPLANHCGARYMQDVHDGSLHFATGNTGWEIVSGTKFYSHWTCLATLFVFDYERFPPEKVLSNLAELKVTSIMAQPTVYRMLTDVGMDKYDLSSVTCMAVGGEKLPPDVAEAVTRQTGHILYEAYAQSEAGVIAALSKNMGRKPGSVGKILPKYHVEILKSDGTFAKAGEEGEIVLVSDDGKRPVGLLMGYLNDEEATRRLWDGNLFHTGDMAVKDEDGFLYYRGRSDGMIKTKGYRVSPVEIEEALILHPAVRGSLAVGMPDKDMGQRIRVYVELEAGVESSPELEEELLAFHNDTCAGFKKIRELIIVPELPRNANGKILRDQRGRLDNPNGKLYNI